MADCGTSRDFERGYFFFRATGCSFSRGDGFAGSRFDEEDGAAVGSLSENPSIFRIFRKSFRKSKIFSDFFGNSIPKSVGDISVTSELDSESLTTLRKNNFKRGSCKFLRA